MFWKGSRLCRPQKKRLEGGDNMKGEILEKLAEECGIYVSDVRFRGNADLFERLTGLQFEQYNLEECSYSLSYIFSESLEFKNYKQVHQFLEQKGREHLIH